MAAIAVTGTPGTGKTELSKELAKQLGYKYIDVNKIIKKEDLEESYDKKRDTYVVDAKKLSKALDKCIKENKDVVIDSHMSHEADPKLIDWCIVTKCDTDVLRERLKKKGYNSEKVQENIDAEILDICREEAARYDHKILVVDTTKKTPKKLAVQLKKLLA